MKKIIFFAMWLFVTKSSFSQQTTPVKILNKQDYLTKSKSQKSAAWSLLGGGGALISAGLLIGNRKESSFSDAATGGILGVIGALSAIGSVPFFIASARNKRKAMNFSTYFKLQQNPVAKQAGFALHSSPALSFKINF